MPGIRLGFGVTKNRALARGIEERLEPWNINTAAVIAGCTVYRDDEYINASRRWVNEEREYMFHSLKKIEGVKVYPSRANYHLVRINPRVDEGRNHQGESSLYHLDAWALKDLMLKKGVLIRTPDGFNYLTPYHFRLAVKDRKSNEVALAALREVLAHHG